jgi:N4-gp56 family major capsid protein
MSANANANFLATVQQNGIKLQEYWDKLMLGMIKLEKDNFVFSNLGVEKDIPANSGTTTISFRRYLSLGVSAGLTKEKLAEAVPPTPLRVEAQKVQGTVNQYGAYIEETDWVDQIHMDDIESIYMPELSRHGSEVIERNVIASFADASEYFVNSKTAVNAYTQVSGNVLTLKEMRKDPMMLAVLGQHTFDKYLLAKEKEWDSYRTFVSEWELKRYLGL